MILVTGCAGFIGSNLCESLLKEGQKIVGIDNYDPYYEIQIKKKNLQSLRGNKNFSFFEYDIANKKQLANLFSQNTFSHVIHLAARPGVSASIKNPLPYIQNNIYGLVILLEQLKNTETKLIFTSSSSVYGGLKRMPFSEEDETDIQLSPYSTSKKAGEMYCRLYHNLYGIPITILRLFTVYGPRVRPDMAIVKFINAITQNKKITLYNNEVIARDFTYIDDIINGIKKSINKEMKFEIINLGGANPVKISYLIQLLEKRMRKKAIIEIAPIPASEMPKTYADISKAKKILNWKPIVSIEEGIKELLNWYDH